MDLILYMDFTPKTAVHEKAGEKKNRIGFPLCLKFQPHRAPGDLLLFFTSIFFFPVDVSYWACRPSLTKHKTRYVTAWWSALELAAADVEAAFLGRCQHIFIRRQCGAGAPSLSRVRLFATDPIPSTRDAGLMAADSHTANDKSPFLKRTLKKKEGCFCVSYKPAMF